MQQREKSGKPNFILIDVDGTDDEIHGEQEGGAYNGYYRHHMLHSLLIFDGETGQIITAVLRPGNAHVKKGFLGILKRLVKVFRERWGKDLKIGLRADGGFAYPGLGATTAPSGPAPQLYDYCESQEGSITYTIGIPPNEVLDRLALPTMEKAELEHERLKIECQAKERLVSQQQKQAGGRSKTKSSEPDNKARVFESFPYQAKSWRVRRKIVVKAEILEKGPNTRFVITNKPDEVSPKAVYDGGYTRRGECENWIKDFKNALQGDRLSCSSLFDNQFRLFLYVAAYCLMDTLRKYLIQM
jgi:Transposase DDE domain group 1